MLKKSIWFFSLAFAVMIFICPTLMTSCTKTNTVIKTDTVNVPDTINVPQKDTMVTTSILTANPWEAVYDRASIGGYIVLYVRGGTNNTMDLDNESIAFSANNTGTYTDNNGNQTSFTWNFTNSTNTSLTWIWNLPTPVTVNWENLTYHNDSISYTEWYITNGDSVLSSEIRVPK